jgi:MSHA biogenesis protein MshK
MRKLSVPLFVAGLLMASAAAAESDPTRPPAAYLGQAPVAGTVAEEGGLRLQSVLTPQHGKPLAIIGGVTVGLGGKVGNATLVRLSEREAVLQGAEGVTRLYLTPDVEKQMIVTPVPRSKGKSRQGKDLP